MKPIKVTLAEIKDAETISEVFHVLDTENYHFSDIEEIKKYIENKDCFVAFIRTVNN